MNYLRRLQCSRLMSEEKGGEGESVGGGVPDNNDNDTKLPFEMTPAIQSYINDAVKAAVNHTNTERDKKEQGLRQNKEDILTELKDAKQKVKDLEHSQRMKAGDVEGVTKEIESRVEAKFRDDLKEARSELANLKETINNNSINSALDAHLEDLKVKSTYRKAFKAELLTENKIGLSEDTGKLLINGEPSETFFKDWSETDVAKDWISVPHSSGGGGRGSGNASGSGLTIADISKMDGSEAFAAARALANKSKR